MEETSENKPIKHICTGLLAHVDAGKTTLAESILYLTGGIRKPGRVDHQDAFLDNNHLERKRGITIFSKQAEVLLGEIAVTLLDTPGHVDFSTEMERTLQVLDLAVLVISGTDGVQGHVQTLWRLLKLYRIPVVLFINKMDQEGTDREKLLGELKFRLDENCVDFDPGQETETFHENVALCEEAVLENYLEEGQVKDEKITELVMGRKIFPCFFGSALQIEGVKELLDGIGRYACCPVYPDEFSARVFKIARDDQGARLTYMKITGGSLRVKTLLTNAAESGDPQAEGIWEEKADQIRIYSGASYQMVPEALAGTICAVTGLTQTFSGEGLGADEVSVLPVLEPVLTYRIQLPEGCDVHGMLKKLHQLEEEEPELHIAWNDQLGEIHAQVMGEIQIEILQSMILERYGVKVEFGSGSIVYKETILSPVEGVGHFEPLRHYAEVHLLLTPLPAGSGLQFESICSEDILDRNWQRLVLTHLKEKNHPGVLTGAEITDMRISLISGRAHQKHTEGGDFRQATYRAVRQGLKCARSILLEPIYEYRLEIPAEMVGRAMSDIKKMQGDFEGPDIIGETAVLTGTAPVVSMRGYQREITTYTRGNGHLFCTLRGYAPCHNEEEVIEAEGYDPEKDLENPTGSVFCSHGAGFVVPWDKVPEYMHVESEISEVEKIEDKQEEGNLEAALPGALLAGLDDELEEIFLRTYGTSKREPNGYKKTVSALAVGTRYPAGSNHKQEREYLLVDGYNIIFAWDDLKELAKVSLEGARNKLADILCNYQGFKKNTLILVFDAYKVEGGQGEIMKYNNIYVVYTKEAETADQYIEKTVHKFGGREQVTVATSDAMEQVIIMGAGARRLSATGLLEEVKAVSEEIREMIQSSAQKDRKEIRKDYLIHHVPKEMADFIEDVRLGRKEFR